MRNLATAATVSLFLVACTSLAARTPTAVPTGTATPPPSSTPTRTATHYPPPTATPEVLANGWYQLELPSVGLTLSFPPEIVRSWSVDEHDVRQPYIEVRFRLLNAAFLVVAAPCHGYSLEVIARSTDLLCGFPGAGRDPIGLNDVLIDGNPALRVVVNDHDLRAGLVLLRHGEFVIEAAGWAGEMDGGVLYSPSERAQILTWFNQILATFRFSG